MGVPSGSYVHANVYDWGMNIDTHVVRADFGKLEGLCGNYDGSQDNDLQHQDSTDTATGSDPHEIHDFIMSWEYVFLVL